MASIVQKTEKIVRPVGSVNSLAAGGQALRVPLNRDSLCAEYRIFVTTSQVIGVAAPTASDIRRLFTSVTLENSDNDRINNADFAALYEVGRLTEAIQAPVVTIGAIGAANTTSFHFEIHLEADDAFIDAASMMQTLGMSNLQLVFNVAPDAASIFTGGAGSTYGAQAVTINVEEEGYPDMIGEYPWGARVQNITTFPKTASGTISQQEPLKLLGRNRTRFIGIQAYDMSGAVPVPRDDLIGTVQIYVGNVLKRETTFANLKKENVTKRNYAVLGSAFIDQGDAEKQYLNFEKADDIYLKYSTLVAVPTKVVFTQVSFTDNGKITFLDGDHGLKNSGGSHTSRN